MSWALRNFRRVDLSSSYCLDKSQPDVAFFALYISISPREWNKPGRLKCTSFSNVENLKKQIPKLPKSLVYGVSEPTVFLDLLETFAFPEELLGTAVISKEGFTVSIKEMARSSISNSLLKMFLDFFKSAWCAAHWLLGCQTIKSHLSNLWAWFIKYTYRL